MNSTDNAFLSQILSIALIVMIFLLFILFIVYIMLRLKKSSNIAKTNNNIDNNGDKSRKKEKVKNISYGKSSIFDFMEFEDIQDNMIIQKNGRRYLMVVECQGVNYDLMSSVEKNAVEEGFQQFLNTLRHPIQIYIQTRTVNLEKSIGTYNKTVFEIESKLNRMTMEYNNMLERGGYTKEQLDRYLYDITKQRNLYEYAKDIVNNTEKMSLNKNILNKNYYIIIPYFSEEVVDEKYDKEEIKNMAFSELYTKSQAIIRTLSACSVIGKILNSYELVDLLYVAYNRDEAEIFGTERAVQAGYDELYSTGRDVFEQKINLLNEQIQNRAVDLANENIVKAKSVLQERAEEIEDNMDDLITNMAEILLEENKEKVGEELAETAIEEIEKQREERIKKEGGNKNVQEKKTRGRPKKSK
ncbi:MAG: hypothetical protein IKF97_05415 [Clostridia bacterium]|nr:hypothetical protein [Clostridia bacterium]